MARTLPLAVALLLALPGTAFAAPTLTVRDLGQDGGPIVADATVAATPYGACPDPSTVATHDACPAWPQFGAVWGPTLRVAGGDKLELAFSGPVDAVAFAATTNFQPGLTAPPPAAPPGAGPLPPAPGTPIVNVDMVPRGDATAGADPATWTLTLPFLDKRSVSPIPFTLVAHDADGFHDFALMIVTPRATATGEEYCNWGLYNTGEPGRVCHNSPPKGGPPPPGAPPPSVTPKPPPPTPTLTCSGTGKRVATGIRFKIRVPRAGKVTVSFKRYKASVVARKGGTLSVVVPVPARKAKGLRSVRLSIAQKNARSTQTIAIS